jgi:4-hydroxy-4-methyl-2-oxoglutarate aldolase
MSEANTTSLSDRATPDPMVARLRRLDSCAVSDALDRCGIDGRVLDGPVRRSGVGIVAGRAMTVLLGPPRPDAPPRHLATDAIEASTADSLLIVAHQARSDCSGWGGNLARAALAQGIAGTIVDGAARDIDEAAMIGYSVYSTSTTPRTARGRTAEHAWGTAVDVCGVRVEPGDLVIADGTGIVTIPADRADEVLAAAEHIAAQEASMAAAIAAGTPISAVMGITYEQATAKR